MACLTGFTSKLAANLFTALILPSESRRKGASDEIFMSSKEITDYNGKSRPATVEQRSIGGFRRRSRASLSGNYVSIF